MEDGRGIAPAEGGDKESVPTEDDAGSILLVGDERETDSVTADKGTGSVIGDRGISQRIADESDRSVHIVPKIQWG